MILNCQIHQRIEEEKKLVSNDIKSPNSARNAKKKYWWQRNSAVNGGGGGPAADFYERYQNFG